MDHSDIWCPISPCEDCIAEAEERAWEEKIEVERQVELLKAFDWALEQIRNK